MKLTIKYQVNTRKVQT